jgi:hypothetical protein
VAPLLSTGRFDDHHIFHLRLYSEPLLGTLARQPSDLPRRYSGCFSVPTPMNGTSSQLNPVESRHRPNQTAHSLYLDTPPSQVLRCFAGARYPSGRFGISPISGLEISTAKLIARPGPKPLIHPPIVVHLPHCVVLDRVGHRSIVCPRLS